MNQRVIGYYDNSRSRGGTTRYLLDVLDALDPLRFRPVFFSDGRYDWHIEMRNRGIEVIAPSAPADSAGAEGVKLNPLEPAPKRPARPRLPRGLAWILGTVRQTTSLVRLFKSRSIDLLHLNNTGAEPAPLAASIAGVPRIVGTWHVDSTYDLFGERQGVNYRLLEALSMRALNHAISVSEATKRDWQRRCHLAAGYPVRVIYNGIEPEKLGRRRTQLEARALLEISPDAFVVGSLGRLEHAKGYEYMLRALPHIVARHRNVVFVLAGTGPLKDDLCALATELGVDRNIRFLGFQADGLGVLEAIDIYVQPSLCEALGYAVLEASGFGLPVVASNVGGLIETLVDGVTAIITPPRDSVALARAINKLIDDSEYRATLGANGAQRIRDHFTKDSMTEQTVALYDELLSKD